MNPKAEPPFKFKRTTLRERWVGINISNRTGSLVGEPLSGGWIIGQ